MRIATSSLTLAADAAITAAQFAAELRANVDAWYAQPNTPTTCAAFTACNGEAWRRVHEAGEVVEDEVLRILRERN